MSSGSTAGVKELSYFYEYGNIIKCLFVNSLSVNLFVDLSNKIMDVNGLTWKLVRGILT